MAFEKTIKLQNCRYDYTLSPSVKKFTLKDNTFFETKVGNYELTRLLEKVPNSGEGFLQKLSSTKSLQVLKLISLTNQVFVWSISLNLKNTISTKRNSTSSWTAL